MGVNLQFKSHFYAHSMENVHGGQLHIGKTYSNSDQQKKISIISDLQ